MKPTRRAIGDLFIWEIIHGFTMTFLGHRIVRGYDNKTGKLVRIYWDKASNWEISYEDIDRIDWVRKDVPYPKPIWFR